MASWKWYQPDKRSLGLDRKTIRKYILRQLRLTGILQTLPVRVKQAEDSKAGYEEFLMTVLEDEYERRQSSRLLRRLRQARAE